MKTQFISLDEAYEQEFLNELRCGMYEGVLHEREYVDEIPMSDVLDIFLQEKCQEDPEERYEESCGIW